jgi:hypothetical protein
MPNGVPHPATYDQNYIVNRSIPEPNSGCWLWLGCISAADGYAKVSSGENAHRVSHRVFNASIPSGLEIDHKCKQGRFV